jgi:hypothetical protein
MFESGDRRHGSGPAGIDTVDPNPSAPVKLAKDRVKVLHGVGPSQPLRPRVIRHGIRQCLGIVEVEARENPSGLAAANSPAALRMPDIPQQL